MRFIPTTVHGVLDYATGAGLIALPALPGWRGAKGTVPAALGAGAIAYSLLTDYELGAVRVIPMPVHLGLDAANGALLAASPWLFGFARDSRGPHVALGLFEIAAALTTQTTPYRGGRSGTIQADSVPERRR